MKRYAGPITSLRQIALIASSLLMAGAVVLALLWLLGGGAAIVHAQGSIRYVAPSGTDSGDCTNAASPCATVQYAVDAAHSGDEIRVATGIYTGVQARAGITQVVYISKTVTVRGGYTGDFTAWDPAVHTTTLDAQGQGRVLYITGVTTPTVEGLRLSGGNAAGLGGGPLGDGAGGGVYVYTATATISGCLVVSNTASTAGTGSGGGLYLNYSGAVLKGNTVQGNIASAVDYGLGGGLYLWDSDATLAGNVFVSNVASAAGYGSGGGLFLRESNATLRDNTVQGNTACTAGEGSGGGLTLIDSDATLAGNTVQGNTASTANEGSGGGLYLNYSGATLAGNTVQSNTASTALSFWGYGGGLYLYWSAATLAGNMVQGNTATTADYGRGGGLYLEGSGATLAGNVVRGNVASTANYGGGGGLFLDYSDATLAGNTVASNVASTVDYGSGGGLYSTGSDVTLAGNTVVSNTATLSQTADGRGGGLYIERSDSFTLINNLVAGNHANTEGSGLWLWGDYWGSPSGRLLHTTVADNYGSGEGVYVDNHIVLTFTNTIITGHSYVGISVTVGCTATLEATLWHGNGAKTGGAGTILTGTVNVDGDPAFVDPPSWDYHLGVGSAAIDAGVDAGVTTDIDGETRPHGGDYDIGADEFNRPPTAAAVAAPATVHGGIVTLDGSGSGDPDGDALTFSWTQTGDPPVTFTPDLSVTTFTAPTTAGILTFTLAVTDSGNASSSDTVTVTVVNQPPIVATVATPATIHGGIVTLDGSGSGDPDGDVLTYGWAQTGGTPVALGDATAISPTFTAPATAGVLTFTLAVTDSFGLSAAAAVAVTITNDPPVADAGAPQAIHSGIVTLDGSGSGDPDGDVLTYGWAQTGGTPVALGDATAISPTFTAPATAGVLTFTLAVTDSFGLSAAAATTVSVTNQPPVAAAGPDRDVNTLALVTLDGSASGDPDGDYPLAYEWAQTGGPAAGGPWSVVSPTFTAPSGPAVLTFTLTVTDSLGLVSAPDEVVVTVSSAPLPALSIAKTVTGEGAGPGGTLELPVRGVVTYTIVLENTGAVGAASVVMTDALPAGVVFGGWVAQNGATPSLPVDAIMWTGAVPAHATHTIRFTATVASVDYAGQTIVNTATFTSANAGAGSSTAAFVVADVSPLLPPALVSPTDSAITRTTPLELRWQTSAGATGYRVNLNGAVVDVGNVTISSTGALADGFYAWTVAAYDDLGRTSDYAAAWSFTVDATAPRVTNASPADGASDVVRNAPIVVEFDEAMDAGSVRYTLTPSVTGVSETWENGNRRLTLAHAELAADTRYTVTVSAGADPAGNPLANAPYTWTFATGAVSAPEADLAVGLARAGAGAVVAGAPVTYTLAISNAGPATPVTATVVNTFEPAAALAGIYGAGCAWTPGAAIVTCTVANVAAGSPVQVTLVVTTSEMYSGTLANTARVAPAGGVVDPDPDDDEDGPVSVAVRSGSVARHFVYLPLALKD